MVRQGTRHDSQESSFQQGMIIRKILSELTGCGVHRNAIARRQRAKEPRRGIAHENGILHGHVHVIENHGDKSLREGRRLDGRGIGV